VNFKYSVVTALSSSALIATPKSELSTRLSLRTFPHKSATPPKET